MTVYVDDMRAKVGHLILSHMLADTDEELHAMADRIGVPRKYHQIGKRSGSHYDICQSKRLRAIGHGAVRISVREMARFAAKRRHGAGKQFLGAS